MKIEFAIAIHYCIIYASVFCIQSVTKDAAPKLHRTLHFKFVVLRVIAIVIVLFLYLVKPTEFEMNTVTRIKTNF